MKIYTDGSCRGNGTTKSEGGYGVVAVNNDETILFHISNGYKKQTTNNEMELMGILTAMELYGDYHNFPDGSVPIVYTDSAYCYNTLTNWMYSWANNGWTRGSKHEPVKNLEIIKRFYELITDKGYKIDLQKVKGHNNIKGNELADKIATGEITTFEKAKEFWEGN